MVRKSLFHTIILVLVIHLCASQYGQDYSSEPNACVQCMNNKTCRPPDCFCCRDELRLPISISDIPQIVFFTFDDALTDSATKFYNQLFNESRKNPNGCPVSMTLFVSHHDTVYTNVNRMYRKGMEIAAHSVSHAHMSNDNFLKEAQNQKRNLANLGGVPENEIVGWRSPFLEPVGDMQPDSLKKLGYTYDATLTYSKRSLKDKAPTPFTLDFGWPYDCKVKPCPKRRHFGFWEVPVVSLLDYLHQYDCVYVDGCNNPPPDETSAFNFLMDNFNSYYSNNRVPFGINMHPSWFYIPERLNAMDRFIKELSLKDDVFIVSVKKMLEWLKNPTGLSQIQSFQPWQCANQQNNQNSHGNYLHNQENQWNKRQDPITRRKSYIQARLEQIRAMRRQSQQSMSHDLMRIQQSNEARKNWWSNNNSPKHTAHTSHSPIHAGHIDNSPKHTAHINNSPKHTEHIKKHQKPAAIAPWVHKKHDRPVRKNARIPALITPSIEPSKEVPFWKRKPKTKDSPVKQNKEVAWWEKAIPQTKTRKPKKSEKLPVKSSAPKAELRNSFNGKTHFLNRHGEKSQNENSQKTVKAFTAPDSPPKVDFKRQLQEQERKQLEMIEKQKKLQKEQLLLQIQQLNENNKKVFRQQQEEEAKRMKDIEKKHILVLNKQKSIKMNQNQDAVLNAGENLQTTVPQTFDQITTTSIPKTEKFSLFPDKNSKTDPWTRFVQFIIRNKP